MSAFCDCVSPCLNVMSMCVCVREDEKGGGRAMRAKRKRENATEIGDVNKVK